MYHPGKEVFLDYVMTRAQDGKQDEVRQLILEGFENQDTLNQESFQSFRSRLLNLVQSKFIEEIVTNMSHSTFQDMN